LITRGQSFSILINSVSIAAASIVSVAGLGVVAALLVFSAAFWQPLKSTREIASEMESQEPLIFIVPLLLPGDA